MSRKHTFSDAEHFAVWQAHDGCCMWCGEPVEYAHATVDHIVPEKMLASAEELAATLTHYGLPTTFNVNSFENWVPAHQSCNGKKAGKVYDRSPAMIGVFERAATRAPRARARAVQLEKEPDQAKAIAQIVIWARKGIVTVSMLEQLAMRGLAGTAPGFALDRGGPRPPGVAMSEVAADDGTGSDDPLGAEIDVYRGLLSRHLFDEALSGFRALSERCAAHPGWSGSRFRLANNSGVCLMGLGRHEEAARSFAVALEDRPESDLARVNLAAAQLLLGKPDDTIALLARPVADLKVRGKAGALRIDAWCRLGRPLEAVEVSLQEGWEADDPHIQLALAKARCLSSINEGGADELGGALRDPDTAIDANVFCAMRELGVAGRLEDGIIPVDRGLPVDRLSRALSHLTAAIELCPDAMTEAKAELHANCGLVQVLMGKPEFAEASFAEAYRISQRPCLTAVVNHAALLMERRDFAEAAHVIRASGLISSDYRLRVQLGEALLGAKAYAEVIGLFADIWHTAGTEDLQLRGAALLLDACRRTESADVAVAAIKRLLDPAAESSARHLHAGRYFALSGRRDEALASLRRAIQLADAGRAEAIEELGQWQAVWRDHLGCVETLASLDPGDLSDAAAESLVVSLYNSGLLERAKEVCDLLVPRAKVPLKIVEVALAIASQAGDVDLAIVHQERLIRERPARLRDLSLLGKLLLRKGDRAGAAQALSTEFDGREGFDDPHDLMVLAHLLGALGDARALALGYRAWERGRNQAQIQLGYVGLFVHRDRENGDAFDLDVVGAGTTVTLAVVGKSRSRTVSIVSEGGLIPDATTWLEPSDAFAARLLGRKVGDEIAGSTGPMGTTTYRVEKVQSVHVRAFQETMSNFNDRFPDAEGLWKFEVPNDDPSQITNVLLSMLGNSGSIRELVSLHVTGRLSIASLAVKLNRPLPSVWSALVHDNEGGVRFSPGVAQETVVAEAVIDPGRSAPVYLDYTALMTLAHLDDELRAQIMAIAGPVRVLQALLDDLDTHAQQALPRGTGDGMTVTLGEDGRLRALPLGDEKGFLLSVLDIARRVAAPHPAYGSLAGGERFEVAAMVLGHPTAELLWEAGATQGIVIADDNALGRTARKEVGVQTCSVQALALLAMSKGRLSMAEYAALVEKLAVLRYSFIALSHGVLEAVLARNRWRPTPEVLAVASCLGSRECRAQDAANLGARALAAVMLEGDAVLTRDLLVNALLPCFTRGHDVGQMLKLMELHLRVHLFLAPPALGALRNAFRLYLRATAQR